MVFVYFSLKASSFWAKCTPKNPSACTILAVELFTKPLQWLETYLLVNNNLCGELFFSSLESPITFD